MASFHVTIAPADDSSSESDDGLVPTYSPRAVIASAAVFSRPDHSSKDAFREDACADDSDVRGELYRRLATVVNQPSKDQMVHLVKKLLEQHQSMTQMKSENSQLRRAHATIVAHLANTSAETTRLVEENAQLKKMVRGLAGASASLLAGRKRTQGDMLSDEGASEDRCAEDSAPAAKRARVG